MARRTAILAVTAVALNFGLVAPASGTLEATDADDVSAKSPFDVSWVRSIVSDRGIVVIHVHFYEKLIWNWPNSGVRIEIDSRAGGGMDYRLQVVPRRGNRNLRCLLGGPWGTAGQDGRWRCKMAAGRHMPGEEESPTPHPTAPVAGARHL